MFNAPGNNWHETYTSFLRELLANVRLARITLGGICSYDGALSLMEAKLGRDNTASHCLSHGGGKCPDGRNRYAPSWRVQIYRHLIATIRNLQSDLPIALCLEEFPTFEDLGLTVSVGRCNCVL